MIMMTIRIMLIKMTTSSERKTVNLQLFYTLYIYILRKINSQTSHTE